MIYLKFIKSFTVIRILLIHNVFFENSLGLSRNYFLHFVVLKAILIPQIMNLLVDLINSDLHLVGYRLNWRYAFITIAVFTIRCSLISSNIHITSLLVYLTASSCSTDTRWLHTAWSNLSSPDASNCTFRSSLFWYVLNSRLRQIVKKYCWKWKLYQLNSCGEIPLNKHKNPQR